MPCYRGEGSLSAKWRRYKRRSKRFHISRDSERAKDRKAPNPFRIRNVRTKRGTHPYKYNLLKTCRRRRWKAPEPLIDVFEENDKIIVVAEFVGFKRENLRIHVKDQRLILSAESPDRKYYKSLNLPERVISNTQCTSCRNGVLEIQFKKALEKKTIAR